LLVGINDQPSYDAWRAYSVKNLPELANILPVQFSPEAKDNLLKTADDISKRLTAAPISVVAGGSIYDQKLGTFTQAPEKAVAPTTTIAEFERAQKDPQFMRFLQERAAAMRPPAQPRPEQPLEKVIDPVTGKIRFATRTEALGMTPASSESKPMTALQQQAFKKDFANDTSKVKSAVSTADELEKLTDELVGNPDKKIAPHPGLGGITGYAALLPSLPSGEAAKAEQKLETFKGKIKALGRAIASQEGKLGNMAVQEWQMVSDAVQAINPRAGNLDVQMRDVVRQARDLARNMQDKFDLTYEDQNSLQTTTPAPGKPAAAGAGSIHDQADAILRGSK
jgi:hypothetical protein